MKFLKHTNLLRYFNYYKYSMMTFKRINEDYIDDRQDELSVEELSMRIDDNVRMLMAGEIPNIDFNAITEPIYQVFNKEELNEVIAKSIELYGNDCSLNWIDVTKIRDMYALFNNSDFNGDISKWDVSRVRNMNSMFSNASFNGDIS